MQFYGRKNRCRPESISHVSAYAIYPLTWISINESMRLAYRFVPQNQIDGSSRVLDAQVAKLASSPRLLALIGPHVAHASDDADRLI